MGRISIQWYAYVIIGAVVVLASVAIDIYKMLLFIIVGGVFILIGLIKLLLLGVIKKQKSIVKHKSVSPPFHQAKQQHAHQQQVTKYVRCRVCSSVNYSHVDRCHKCKTRFR
jgi:hypothetical protein